MGQTILEFGAQVASLETRVASEKLDNFNRREFYSKVELLRLDLEEAVSVDESKELVDRLNSLNKKLELVPYKPKKYWWHYIDLIWRFIGVVSGFVTLAVYFPLPLFITSMIDRILGNNSFNSSSVKLRRLCVRHMLVLSGVSADVKYDSSNLNDIFSGSCAILSFTHASNIDGFCIASTCPIRHVAIAKKELFVVPFFSWISLAIGGMPIDRQNKERAIKVLKISSELAKNDKLCIVIAPEGTRSTTGNLLPYKKGAFHMWKDLKCPIVPFVMYGTYDLYPTGTWVNNTGKVAIRYLKPITPEELSDKTVDDVLKIVRRRTLEALAECPKNICTPLTWRERLYSVFFTFCMHLFNTCVAYYANNILFHKYGFNHWHVYGWLLCIVIAITIILYVYNLYILPNLYSIPVDKKDK